MALPKFPISINPRINPSPAVPAASVLGRSASPINQAVRTPDFVHWSLREDFDTPPRYLSTLITIEAVSPEGVRCTFRSDDNGKTWGTDGPACDLGYVNRQAYIKAEKIPTSPMLDWLNEVLRVWQTASELRPEPAPDIAEEFALLDQLVADVQLPPEAYNDEGNVIVVTALQFSDDEMRKGVEAAARVQELLPAKDGQVFRRSAGVIGWGAVDLADTNVGKQQVKQLTDPTYDQVLEVARAAQAKEPKP